MSLEQWALFAAIWFAGGIPLGPNAMNCITVSATQGLRRALWAVLGVVLAGAVHIAAGTALGASAVSDLDQGRAR